MPIGRAKSMGIREAFYMTFSYKEIRLCLAIGKPVLIVTGYGVQASAGRSSQDGRRRTVSVQRSAVRYCAWRPAFSGQVWRSAFSGQRIGTAVSVQRSAHRYGDKAPFVPHLFCAPPDFRRPTAVFRSAHSLQKSYPQAQIEGCPIWLWIRRFR